MPRPAALAAAAALLLACGPRRLTPGEYQRQLAHVLSPAPVRAPPAAVRPAEVKTPRLLAYADAEHRASAPDWEARILDLACDLKWIMADEYAVVASTFSPESERLVRVGLSHRAAATPEARLAWRDAWRAEAARMQSVSWECPKLERSLADTDAWLAKAFARDELELRAVPASAPAPAAPR